VRILHFLRENNTHVWHIMVHTCPQKGNQYSRESNGEKEFGMKATHDILQNCGQENTHPSVTG
jgi:hypothetical protein